MKTFKNIKSEDKAKLAKWVMLVAASAFFVLRSVQMISENSVVLAHPAATLYLLDYQFYYGTRTFIGSLISLFTYNITYQQIFTLNICVYIATGVSIIGMASCVLKKAIKENNTFLFFVSMLLFVFPYSVLRYANWIGIYDIYLALAAVLCSLVAGKKYVHWLCPVIFVMAIFTHHSFVLIYFPAVFFIQVYHILKSDFKKSYIASTVSGLIIAFVSAVYCVFFANSTIKMSRDELFAYMQDRLGTEVLNKVYIDVYYFNEKGNGLSIFREKEFSPEFLLNFFVFFLPVMLLFAALWYYYITNNDKKQFSKKEKKLHKKNSRFQLICGLLFLTTLLFGIALIFLMEEEPRWMTAATLSQFMILFTLINNKDPVIESCLIKKNTKKANIAMAALVVYCIVANFMIQPYFSDPMMITRIQQ